jgi:hypothetical protein
MDDMNFWLTKAKSLNLSADSVFESSGWVVLALMLVGAPIFNVRLVHVKYHFVAHMLTPYFHMNTGRQIFVACKQPAEPHRVPIQIVDD